MTDPTLNPLVQALSSMREDPTQQTRLATVTQVASSGIYVRFDGETAASERRYQSVGHAAIVGDRVLMLKSGSTWVIVGAIYTGTGWTGLSFATGWSNLGGVNRVCEYQRIGRWVNLRGHAVIAAGGGTTVGTLPTGFRPAANETYAVPVSTAGSTNTIRHLYVIASTGVLSLAGGMGVGDWISLSSIRFEADA